MARRMSLEDANKSECYVLFDSNVLINAYKSVQSNDPYGLKARDLLMQINGSRRFTSELVLWEFLHPNLPREDMNSRRKWLKKNFVKVKEDRQWGYIDTFKALVVLPQARGNPVDGTLAAYSIASKGKFVIATADGDDFCWHKDIAVIVDFFRGQICY